MGQYHTLACPERNAVLSATPLGAMLKAWEQLGHKGVGGALSLLCATGMGAHPRDLPWANIGQWAGCSIAYIGDYAEDGDTLGHPFLGVAGAQQALYQRVGKPGRPSRRHRKTATCIAAAMIPLMERVGNMRLSNTGVDGKHTSNGHTQDFVGPVLQMATGWELDTTCAHLAALTPTELDEHVAYLGRMDPTSSWKRPPITMKGAPDAVPSASEVGHGSPVLWVSLDAGEYLDPACFGALDLVDAVTNTATLGFVMATLFHDDRRGGGDLPNDGILGVVGRWRGDRLALIGTQGIKVNGKILTHEDIRATFRNVSSLAEAWNLMGETMDSQAAFAATDPDTLPKSVVMATRHHAQPLIPAEGLANNGMDLRIRVRPRTLLDVAGKTFTLPPRVDLVEPRSGGKVWLNRDARTALIAAANADVQPGTAVSVVVKETPNRYSRHGGTTTTYTPGWGQSWDIQAKANSAHEALMLAAHA